ncbi:MAG: hypothetical protein Q9213_004376 [Squamulea squamosa]
MLIKKTTVSICLVSESSQALGKAAYLGAITTVFAHPGRRFGQVVEALILALTGTCLGLAWSLLGIYLSSLVVSLSSPAAYSIRGVFLACALIFHGFLRSNTPRLWVFVLLLIIVSVVTLTSTASAVTSRSATQILYPVLSAVGVVLTVNLLVFPEFSSTFLGETIIETLHDTAEALRNAGQYFIAPSKQTEAPSESSADETGEKAERSDDVIKQLSKTSTPNGFLHRFLPSRSHKPLDADSTSEASAISLQDLVGAKAKLRSKQSICTAAQTECAFEIAFAVLPPWRLKPISAKSMKKLIANVVAVIGACESKYALLGDRNDNTSNLYPTALNEEGDKSGIDVSPAKIRPVKGQKVGLDLVKPKREIEFGDARLLQSLLARTTRPYTNFVSVVSRAVDLVNVCIAYTYNVSRLPSGAKAPKKLVIEEVDVYIEELSEALRLFDNDIAAALESAVETPVSSGQELDVTPREEIFLVASFVLNLRQAATHIEDMLKSARSLVRQRQSRHDRRRFYAPRIKWSKWLYSGGEELEALPASGRKQSWSGQENEKADDIGDKDTVYSEEHRGKAVSSKQDLERGPRSAETVPTTHEPPIKTPAIPRPDPTKCESLALRLRGRLADGVEWVHDSDDLLYAFKLTVAVFLVAWPAFVARWNQWYSLNRGLWAALQLVFITEVSIGSSVMMFILRGIGITFGCLWGWAALEARSGNRVVVAAMVCLGLIPSTYVQLGSKYPKAGQVCIVSICVVALSTELQTVPGSATENFLKRWLAFVIGGIVALVVEIAFLPVKARTRLVESLTAAIRQISEMENCIAAGIEEGVNLDVYDPKALKRFEDASGKASGALTAAKTFLPFCKIEPRIKGSFEGQAEIYTEILFVLHQIVDRMDNMLQLRTAYGSGPLEELHVSAISFSLSTFYYAHHENQAQIYPYRRNIAGSISLTLFAIQTSLMTKLALPQFFPSARLAHLRIINRIREIIEQKSIQQKQQEYDEDFHSDIGVRHQAVRRKYIAWNAASAARAEIIEYVEELIDLTKLLMGANEFRSGLLKRDTYLDYVQGLGKESNNEAVVDNDTKNRENRDDGFSDIEMQPVESVRRRRLTTIMSAGSGEEKLPASLQRIQSRKMEEGIKRQATNEGRSR